MEKCAEPTRNPLKVSQNESDLKVGVREWSEKGDKTQRKLVKEGERARDFTTFRYIVATLEAIQGTFLFESYVNSKQAPLELH